MRKLPLTLGFAVVLKPISTLKISMQDKKKGYTQLIAEIGAIRMNRCYSQDLYRSPAISLDGFAANSSISPSTIKTIQ